MCAFPFQLPDGDRVVFRYAGNKWQDKLGLGIIRKITPEQEICGPETFPFFAVCIVLRGKGEYIDWENKKHYPLEAGSYFLRIPGVFHQIRIDLESDWQECFLDMGYHTYPCFLAFRGISAEHPVGKFTPDENWMTAFFALQKSLQFCPEHDLLGLLPRFFELAEKVLHQVVEEETAARFMKEACDYLSSDFKTPPDLQAFCESHGWGYENFRKVFARTVGMAPYQYRTLQRQKAAYGLLLQKNLSIAFIASELGYRTASEFSSHFKKTTGQTPSEFRKQNAYMML